MLSSAAARYQLQFQQDEHLWAFVCYLLLLYLYSSAVGGRHSNEFPACSNTRPLAASWFQTNSWRRFIKNKSCLVQYFQSRCLSFFATTQQVIFYSGRLQTVFVLAVCFRWTHNSSLVQTTFTNAVVDCF